MKRLRSTALLTVLTTIGVFAEANLYTASARMDRIVEGNLVAEGVRPYAVIDDATFVRRSYLQLVGRIPTLEESEDFLKSKSLKKRRLLVDRLVESNGFVSHFYNYWADILRVKSRLRGIPGNAGDPYIKWIKTSLAENKPYDEFVFELITSHGDTWDEEAGPSGYYRRDRGMPLDNLANTAQIFLGTQIQCAQCHDHPFDQWTQKEFFELAAFTNMAGPSKAKGKGKSKVAGTADLDAFERFRREAKKKHGNEGVYRYINKAFNDVMGNAVPNRGSGTLRLPKDYQYNNAKPNDLVRAQALFGEKVTYDRNGSDANSRVTFAKWMTSRDNPRFTRVIANRLWKHMMGTGLFEPVDDIREDTKPSIPLLMDHLETEMKAADYDLRHFIKMIAYSRSWQRVTHAEELDLAKPYYFPGPVSQRLSAEQIWDSLLTLKVPNVDDRKSAHMNKAVATYEHLDKMNADQLMAELERVAEKLKDKKTVKGNDVAKAMNIGGGGGMSMAMDMNADLRDEMSALARQLKLAKRQPERAKVIRGEMAELRQAMARNKGGALRRASELPNPPPPGHFLREFGSSDREIIENAASEASVTQALHLLNGFVDKDLVRDSRSVVWKSLGDDPKQLADRAFLTILARPPSARERAIVKTYQEQAGDEAKAEVIWALVNTREFLFLR